MKEQLESINQSLAKLVEQGDKILLANLAQSKEQKLNEQSTTTLHMANTIKIQSETITTLLQMLIEKESDT